MALSHVGDGNAFADLNGAVGAGANTVSKGGTTAAGMEKMDVPEFKKIVAATLAAAARRSKELA